MGKALYDSYNCHFSLVFEFVYFRFMLLIVFHNPRHQLLHQVLRCVYFPLLLLMNLVSYMFFCILCGSCKFLFTDRFDSCHLLSFYSSWCYSCHNFSCSSSTLFRICYLSFPISFPLSEGHAISFRWVGFWSLHVIKQVKFLVDLLLSVGLWKRGQEPCFRPQKFFYDIQFYGKVYLPHFLRFSLKYS